MPFAGFENFNACLTDEDMKKRYPDEETRKKVCGALQAKTEKEHSEILQMRELRAKIFSGKYSELDGGLLIKDVKLLATGTWIDSHIGTPLFYPEKILEKYAGNWIDNSLWSRHSGGMPRSITDKIGEIRDPRYNDRAVIGDLWLHQKTQTSRDTAELIKSGLVDYVSVEHGGKERWNAQEKRYDAEEIVFGGVAVVNRGACKVCTIHNEEKEIENLNELEALDIEMRVLAAGCRDPDLPASAYAWVEDPEKKTTWHMPYKGMDGQIKCQCVRAAIAAIGGARTGEPMSGVPDSAKAKLRTAAKSCEIETEFESVLHSLFSEENMTSKDTETKGKELENGSDITALEVQLKEAELAKAKKALSELEMARGKITELEQIIKEQDKKLASIEHDTRVKELQAKIAELSKEPVYHTKMAAGSDITVRELELDNEEFPAYTARDFGE